MKEAISKRYWILLWICLILINVVMRIPLTPHEIGHDSFLMHYLADSISTFGHAKWWIHSLSIIGLYPFSYASAFLFYLSGASQLLSLMMERTIWVVLLILGIFSSFTVYLMAGAIRDDKIFKFITALVYSTSPGLLAFTTWDASARGMFLVLLPLFIYCLIKARFSKFKFILLVVVLFTLLMATHNLFFFTIPIILSYIIALMLGYFQIRSSNLFTGSILLLFYLIIFSQFSIQRVAISELIFTYVRYIGVAGVFIIGGFISLLFKRNKTLEENFIVLILLFFSPFVSYLIYGKFLMLPFEALMISYGMVNLIRISQHRKIAFFIIMISIILSIGFAQFYQFSRTNIDDRNLPDKFWAEESTVNAALWTKSHTDKIAFTDNALLSRRILAYSGVEMLSESEIVNFIQGNVMDFNMSVRSPLSISFYSEGPYHVEDQRGLSSWIWLKLGSEGLNSKWSYLADPIGIYIKDERINTIFSRSSEGKEMNKLFDNGKISISEMTS